MKRQIMLLTSNEDLVSWTFSLADSRTIPNWKHEGEFELSGSMYDIVKTVFSSDSVTYHCWPDEKETKLNVKLKELSENAVRHDPLCQERSNRMLAFMKKFLVVPFNLLLSDNEFLIVKWNHPINESALSRQQQTEEPPPNRS